MCPEGFDPSVEMSHAVRACRTLSTHLMVRGALQAEQPDSDSVTLSRRRSQQAEADGQIREPEV